MSDTLAYGLRTHPTDRPAVWGARLIWPNDLVYDRQDFVGDDDARKDLMLWLNDGALRRALDHARYLASSGTLRSSDDTEVTLFDDERGTIKANPQRSFGYLYVAGWLK